MKSGLGMAVEKKPRMAAAEEHDLGRPILDLLEGACGGCKRPPRKMMYLSELSSPGRNNEERAWDGRGEEAPHGSSSCTRPWPTNT